VPRGTSAVACAYPPGTAVRVNDIGAGARRYHHAGTRDG